jgi:hypothetical protein
MNMGYVFYVLLIMTSVLCGLLLALAKYSDNKKAFAGCLLLFVGAFITLMVVGLVYTEEVRLVYLEHFKIRVKSVDGPNTFSVKIGLKKIQLVLSGTIPPLEEARCQEAEQILRQRIEKKKVRLDFPSKEIRNPMPVVVFLDDGSINEIMIGKGLLDSGAPPMASEPQSDRAMPIAVRVIIWAVVGFVGASLLGQVLNGRGMPLIFLLVIAALAIRSIVTSVQNDISLVPPVVCLGIIVLLGGYFKGIAKQVDQMKR